MHGLLLTFADTSKVPWYILGGVLALWGVVIATVGLKLPSFPAGRGAERAVMAGSVVMIVLAIGASIATA